MTETYTIDANGKATIIKDPDENLDYSFNWSDCLSPTSDTVSNTTTLATAFVFGGVSGSTATLSCSITTAQGRVAQRSVYLKIKER